MQQKLPVVSRRVLRAGAIDIPRRKQRENQQNEDENEGLAVIGRGSSGGIHHIAKHVALRSVEPRANHVGDASLIGRLAHLT